MMMMETLTQTIHRYPYLVLAKKESQESQDLNSDYCLDILLMLSLFQLHQASKMAEASQHILTSQ